MKNKRKPNPVLETYFKAQGSCCYYCRQKILFCHITRDHISPKSKGGQLRDNCVFACRLCNVRKGAKTLEEFKLYVINIMIGILRKIVANKFIATQSDIDKLKNNHRIMQSVVGLINNNNKPVFDI